MESFISLLVTRLISLRISLNKIHLSCSLISVYIQKVHPENSRKYRSVFEESTLDNLVEVSVQILSFRFFRNPSPDQIHETHKIPQGTL